MKRPRRPGLRLGAAAFAFLSGGGIWLTAQNLWSGLSTGAMRAKYGMVYRVDRPIMFDITLALNGIACLLWLVFMVVALGILFGRNLDDL